MAKEYSIYFDTRKIVITTRFDFYFKDSNGLFIKYENPKELSKLLVFFKSTSSFKTLYLIGSDVKMIYKSFVDFFMFVQAAGGLVQNENDEVLLIKRNGIWDLPKGKAIEGESSEVTAVREVIEECGITKIEVKKRLLKTYHTYHEDESFILKETAWFQMKFSGKEQPIPQTIENITEVRWVKKGNLSEYTENTYQSIRDVLHSAGLS